MSMFLELKLKQKLKDWGGNLNLTRNIYDNFYDRFGAVIHMNYNFQNKICGV